MLTEDLLARRIMRDRYNPLVFRLARGRNVYLVGGFLRDLFRGIRSADRDFIVDNEWEQFGADLNREIGGTLVKFDKGDMLRIVTPEGTSIDVSGFDGNLEQEMSGRDFTVNALSWSPRSGLNDFHDGVSDIGKKRIRIISKENMLNDPLRILRAYRFAAEMNGFIESKTRKVLKSFCRNIQKIAHERITLELFNLLNAHYAGRYLGISLTDGLLIVILSISRNKLEENIKVISHLEDAYFNSLSPRYKASLKKKYSQNLTYKGLLCLEQILYTRSGSDFSSQMIAASNAIRKRVESARKGIALLTQTPKGENTNLFSLFERAGEASLDVLALTSRDDLIGDYKRFLRISRKSLLSSEEIMKVSGCAPGKRLGKLIAGLKKARFESRVHTKKEARAFIENF
jgi:tRNA nucleotidyltransferase/poly(A) polymerase